MPNVSIKVIVSNKGALINLYGLNNFNQVIDPSLTTLIGTDQGRFIQTRIVYPDDAATMNTLNAPVVANPADERQNKAAIDGVYNALNPDYLDILGAIDIIPMQSLINPAAANDGEATVPSDLPYACAQAYSTSVNDFIGPTRVIARIAGITGDASPASLVASINTACSLQARPAAKYQNPYFALSAAVWQGSSRTSTTNIFGNANALQLSPPSGPNWTNPQMLSLTHFVNCHGGDHDPQWYGQNGGGFPVAESAQLVAGKTAHGGIAAAECCYGGQLYAPNGGQAGLCNTYLMNGAAAFCGSTNIAYGPANGQGNADLITQYFLIDLLNGASAGRAMLQARQKLVQTTSPMNIYDLKTLAQFNVFGSSSNTPVQMAAHLAAKGITGTSDAEVAIAERKDRRRQLMVRGLELLTSTGIAEHDPNHRLSEALRNRLLALADEHGIPGAGIQSCPVVGGSNFLLAHSLTQASDTIHVVHGTKPEATFGKYMALIVRERGGIVISSELLLSK
ncbi:MAG: hypothetical protein WCF85_18245 [Rhodospirillaceae bacterium]